MKHHTSTPGDARLEQVFLFERDAGLLCRVLGLYAARGLDVLHADYAWAAQDVMLLKVAVSAPGDDEDARECLRVLVDKASTFVGMLAAEDQRAAVPA